MSTGIPAIARALPEVDLEKRHRLRLTLGYTLAVGLVVALTAYGFDYYKLDSTERPFSAKHQLLSPGGSIGLGLGVLGVLFFLIIFLYAVRKRWPWLKQRGSSRHWLDFHVLLGLTAPFVIAFHASFKFRGLAGMAFWIMSAVAVSGIIGRYLFAQIPRSLNAAELSLKEAQDLQLQLTEQLAAQNALPAEALAPLFQLPAAEKVQIEPLLLVLISMVAIDLRRTFRIARVRWQTLSFWGAVARLGGLFPAGNREVETVISLARRQAGLSKRILFLSRTHKVFHLWHVVHRPFSYSFAVLAVIHITVVMLFGVR
jgi:hypothetical protein